MNGLLLCHFNCMILLLEDLFILDVVYIIVETRSQCLFAMVALYLSQNEWKCLYLVFKTVYKLRRSN
jgi:hypothetical protein